MDDPARTTRLLACLDRMQAGDQAAREELLLAFGGRLERLARKMLRRFPGVRRWAQTGDVLQNSLLRLLRALEQVRLTTTREFFSLAAEQMRRELLDLARHFNGPHGLGANYDSQARKDPSATGADDPPDRTEDADELERWCAFHQEVERLPVEEREVVGLIYYHGWKQTEVAELLDVTVRTVQRHWQKAMVKLHGRLRDEE